MERKVALNSPAPRSHEGSLAQRIFAEAEKPHFHQQIGDAFKTLHRWGSKAVETANDWSDRGGIFGGGGESGSATERRARKPQWTPPKAADSDKAPSPRSVRLNTQRQIAQQKAAAQRDKAARERAQIKAHLQGRAGRSLGAQRTLGSRINIGPPQPHTQVSTSRHSNR